MLDGLLTATGVLLEWPNLLWVIGGVLFGMFIGFLPGMAGSVALALLIPVSFTMPTETAVLFLIAAYSPVGFGGMLTSILVNTPGSPENAATTFDGYPMAKQGRAGAAIGAATAASVIGGLLGTVVLLAFLPLAQNLVLSFSYPEFFMMAMLGLVVITVITERNTFKGLVAAAVGFLLAFIGLDPITGAPRFTFDQLYLFDGIDVVPVLMGLFAGAEILALFGKGTAVDSSDFVSTKVARSSLDGPVTFWDGVRETFQHKFLIVRSSIIGTVIGVIPGVGGSVSSFLAYSQAKQFSRRPDRFGKGAIEGVIAAESANDAKEGGSLLPTVAFGIPGTVGMAVLLGALIMKGVPAGPTMLVNHMDLIYLLIIGMVASKFIAPFVVALVAGKAVHLTRLRPGVFTPLIAMAALVGAYTVNVELLDVVVTVVFGYVGYAMRRYGFSRVALVIALVLGGLVERSYHQMMGTFGDAWVVLQRPISGVLAAVMALFLGYAIYTAFRRRGSTDLEPQGDGEVEEEPVTGPQPGRLVFDLVLLGFSGVIVWSAWGIHTDARSVPLLVGAFAVVGMVYVLVADLLVLRAQRVSPAVDVVHADEPVTAAAGSVAEPHGGVATAPAHSEVQTTRGTLERQAWFGVWTVGFVAFTAVAGLGIAIPVSLVAFFRLLARESWLLSISISVVAWGLFYLIFDRALGRPIY